MTAPMTAESTTQPPSPQPHFVLAPLAAHGHVIPMVDLAGLLAAHGARASLVTTPLNATRLRGVADKAAREKLPLEIVELPFSPAVAGLPSDCQNADKLSEDAQLTPFLIAMRALDAPFEAYVRALERRPSCIISDWCNTWAAGVAWRIGIPRLFFHGPSCFYSLCDLNAVVHGLHEQIVADDEQETTYVVPRMPVRVTVTKGTAPGFFNFPGYEALRDEAIEAMLAADGVVVNTFLDLEAQFVACYEAALGKPVWTLGPLCLHNRDDEAMASCGTGSTDLRAITAWLDEQVTGSVVYVSFGSVLRKLPKHLFEVGNGLEDSGKPFLWVVKESELVSSRPEVQEWLDEFMARTATRGLVVRGWAPQVTILSHRAVGGFLTHCGWNSLLEAIARGVPVATWPHFADQFLNERLAVDVLGVGVPIGVTAPVSMLNEEYLTVDRGDVARVVSVLMDGGGEEAEERRRKAKEYGEQARRAMAKGGSSYENVMRLIARFMQTGVEEH
ncbi:UDP-glycosyltransferase 73C3 [Oryza sativa Japonica Group]|jgi:UDP-glucosyl transferase 73C|uniref:Glycosyltransferase n=2 Tax=Oryza sativa subsp. japonica TaxID=39947 RepID=Q0E2X2_ORYSJ|nr:UDP-glycosyltransferase 73C3 [Oryza sativa Japonica Group]XP_015622597.1 UDP-glycosyltransferase 73C3 [Oryza sativa Japonica Group]XP_015622598.1 UDP-glycosyltransferase 73C3 [Oryza sativa Japonica Group]KAF2943681.1 hypothetical protein DAI22_02g082700 [Oryza sativa Japonica Group]BAF08166.2 Os02g0206400 [Oryza sativa Japonica Group]|eukprot:NP_001046252.2 Os02g0206400 [Oryza sativa Japonica Group]